MPFTLDRPRKTWYAATHGTAARSPNHQEPEMRDYIMEFCRVCFITVVTSFLITTMLTLVG